MGLETAAIISLTSLAVGAAGSAKSFSDASKQKEAAKNAEQAAEKARDAALKKLDVNYLKGTSIAKEAYKLDRQRQLVAGTRAMESATGSDRGSAATAGRVLSAENVAGASTTASMETSLVDRENAILAEDGRLRDAKVEVNLAEAEGASMAARDAEESAALATTAGIEGVTNVAQSAGQDFLPLYMQNKDAQFAGANSVNFTAEDITAFDALGGGAYDKASLAGLDHKGYKDWKKGLSDEQWAMITKNQGYINSLN